MQWLPAITIHEHLLVLPISDGDFLRLLAARVLPAAEVRRQQWLGVLLQSPAALIWALQQQPHARDFSEFLPLAESALVAQRGSTDFIAAAPPRIELDFDTWRSDLEEYLLGLRKAIQIVPLRPPLAEPPPTLVRVGKNLAHGPNRRAAISAGDSLKTEILGHLERLVRPFAPSAFNLRAWLDELFADFQFAAEKHDATHAQAVLANDEMRRAVDSWQSPPANDPSELCALVLQRLATADRLADDFQNEKLASLKQLAYGASHEINNPLANIATRAQLLLTGEKDDGRRKQLTTIFQQAMRAHEMISDMMLFAHPPSPVVQPVDWLELLPRACREFESFVQQAGWTIACTSDTASVPTMVDPSQIISLLRALVQNAVESRASGHVVLHCRPAGDSKSAIEVRDNGPGVSEQARRHMFDPFYSGREAGRGLGFGLSKAWTIARLHGGNLRVESTSSHGTTIVLELPIAGGENPKSEIRNPKQIRISKSQTSATNKT